MSQLVQSIVAAAQALPEGGLLSPKEFLTCQPMRQPSPEPMPKSGRIGPWVLLMALHRRFQPRSDSRCVPPGLNCALSLSSSVTSHFGFSSIPTNAIRVRQCIFMFAMEKARQNSG